MHQPAKLLYGAAYCRQSGAPLAVTREANVTARLKRAGATALFLLAQSEVGAVVQVAIAPESQPERPDAVHFYMDDPRCLSDPAFQTRATWFGLTPSEMHKMMVRFAQGEKV